MARIAIGGFQHETNTFAPVKADYRTFFESGGWPGLTRGPGMLTAFPDMNLPIAGFIEAARAQGYDQGHDLVPLAWAQAVPAAHVTEDAFERILGYILEDLAAALPVEAVYLDLHGAMVTEHLQDGEGEILARVRGLIGAGVPLVASLDLHANVTPRMMELADVLVAYRTYPHIDMAETGARAAALLTRLLGGESFAGKAFRKLPFLIPLQAGCTMIEPAQGLYARLEDLEAEGAGSVSFNAGFGPADIHDCGPSVLAYAASQAAAERAADTLEAEILAREADFAMPIWSPAEAVAHAKAKAAGAGRPVVLADSQDNPGGGGNGDTVGLLAALVAGEAEDAVLAILADPAAAAAAHEAGEGAFLDLAVGAISGMPGHVPYKGRFEVERLGDGNFTCTGPFAKGLNMQLGPMALLRLGGVRLVVATRKVQAADQEIFRHLGLEPAEQKIVALKSSVHFRAHFAPIAEEILVVKAPGPNALDYTELDYRNLRPGVRVMPLGPEFAGPG